MPFCDVATFFWGELTFAFWRCLVCIPKDYYVDRRVWSVALLPRCDSYAQFLQRELVMRRTE